MREAACLAAAHHAELIVMTVIPRDFAARTGVAEIREYARAEHLRGELEACGLLAEDVLEEAKAVVSEHGNLKASYTSRAGDPATEIVTCACERAVDLIFNERHVRAVLAEYVGYFGISTVGAHTARSVSARHAQSICQSEKRRMPKSSGSPCLAACITSIIWRHDASDMGVDSFVAG